MGPDFSISLLANRTPLDHILQPLLVSLAAGGGAPEGSCLFQGGAHCTQGHEDTHVLGRSTPNSTTVPATKRPTLQNKSELWGLPQATRNL